MHPQPVISVRAPDDGINVVEERPACTKHMVVNSTHPLAVRIVRLLLERQSRRMLLPGSAEAFKPRQAAQEVIQEAQSCRSACGNAPATEPARSQPG